MRQTPANESDLDRHRRLRLVATWVAYGVFFAGNAAGLLNWIQWGPQQLDKNERRWVLASAFGFWVASCLLLVLLFDTWLLIRYGVTPLSYKDLDGKGPIRARADRIKQMAENYRALVGVGGLILGAVIAHLVWQP